MQKQLKQLKRISPSPAFMARTKIEILAEKPKLSYGDLFYFWMKKPAVIGSFAFIAVCIALVSFLSPSPTASSLQNPEMISEEMNALAINVHLKELTYQKNADSMIMAAITEIKDSKSSHLNPSILDEESSKFDSLYEQSDNENINKLLDSVIF